MNTFNTPMVVLELLSTNTLHACHLKNCVVKLIHVYDRKKYLQRSTREKTFYIEYYLLSMQK